MIIEIPILSGHYSSSVGNYPKLNLFNNLKYTLTYNLNDALVFPCILPNTYDGASIDVKLFWFVRSVTGSQSLEWRVAIQRLNEGANLLSYAFGTFGAVSTNVNTAFTQMLTTINLPLASLGGLVAGDLFRIYVKLSNQSAVIPADLTNIALFNGS